MIFNTLVVSDVQSFLSMFDPGVADLIFCDPPFNQGVKYDVCYDQRDDYWEWCGGWMEQCYEVLRDGGAFWLAINDENVSRLKHRAENRGFVLRNWVIWAYGFGQHCESKFGRGHTHLLYFIKPAKEPNFVTFNGSAVRIPSDRQTKYNDKRANPDGRVPSDVWFIPRVCGTHGERWGSCPAQMPEAVLERIILACSNPGDLVVDPFLGTGTTTAVAARLGRRYMGCDISPLYVREAHERLLKGRISIPPETSERIEDGQ